MDFREADRRYAELKRRLDAGGISVEQFDAQRLRLMVQDEEGRRWAKGLREGKRCYRAEYGWVRNTPPGDQPPPADGASGRWSQLEQTKPVPRGAGNEVGARSYHDSSGINRRYPKRARVARLPRSEQGRRVLRGPGAGR